MKNRNAMLLVLLSMLLAGCSTTIATKQGHGNGGIPYYLPKAVLHVKEPIEWKRIEDLYAIVQIGGLTQFLYPINKDNIDEAIEELKGLANLGDENIKFIPLPKEMTIETEHHQETDNSVSIAPGEHKSETKTKKNLTTDKFAAITSTQTINTFSYKPSDTSKAYEVVLVPDTSKPYELFIKNTGLINSEVDLTLTDGWNLTSIGVKNDSTAALSALSSIAGSIIGAQKEIKVAEITKSQQLELEKLKQQGAAGSFGSAQSAEQGPTEVSYSILGYTRKVTISFILPGIYPLDDPTNLKLKIDKAIIWQPISF